ncbi:MKRN2 opposite strand protein [Hetaerina americana]|uniref:MKRN2 opposite strand protein n=1 Tax=Hetaerina americana TaxID=62018 RepID=UPI003A7F41E1
MDTDPGILCFQHCGPKVFCFGLGSTCPACGQSLEPDTHFMLLPFRVPYPFARATQHPCSVVIRPTNGDFLNDYLNSKDLHIAVTSSSGVVVEFDRSGLQQHLDGDAWKQCIVLNDENAHLEMNKERWDDTLIRISKQPCWSSDSYDENSYNCYTFVLAFLRNLNCGSLSEAAAGSRTSFCEKFIVPRTTAAGKYVSVYRRVRNTGHYIQK